MGHIPLFTSEDRPSKRVARHGKHHQQRGTVPFDIFWHWGDEKKSKKAIKQFAYQLEHITKPLKGKINLNGLTSILEYKENHFFIIERTYQSGYGNYGNGIKIFDAYIDETTTNILEVESLKETDFTSLRKRLIFDFEEVRGQLTKGIVDNIEGVTFGPKLANGNQSLILVSDDNFQLYGKQLNQIILLEIEK